jgi:hypothetical protein
MGFFDKLKAEVKIAGNAAKGAIDEGKVRIDIFRVRQSADAAAQALGYALHRARRDGRELDAETLERLDGTLAKHEAEATRLETELARHRGETPPKSEKGGEGEPSAPAATAPGETPPKSPATGE